MRPGKSTCARFATAIRASLVSVRDDGKGLPESFDLKNGGLGMTIVDAFVEQSGAQLEIRRHPQGTEFLVSVSVQEVQHP